MDVIRVVDVPVGATTVEAQRLMNEPCAGNLYMLVQVLPLPGGSTRAFYQVVGRAYIDSQKPGSAARMNAKVAEDTLAVEFLKANLSKTSRDIEVAFRKETGIKRSYMWFQRRRRKDKAS